MSEVTKHGTHDQQSHAGGRGGRGGGAGGGSRGGSAVSQMTDAVNGAASLAIKHGDARSKDVAYSATKDIDTAREKMKQGDYDGAREHMEDAHDKVMRLPEMVEDAGASSEVVGQFATHTNGAATAYNRFVADEQKLNDLAIDLWNHKQGVPLTVRTGKLNTPSAIAFREKGKQIIDQAVAIYGSSFGDAERALGRLMGS